jgi:hypothetical protein
MRRPTTTEQVFIISLITCVLAISLYVFVFRGVLAMQEELAFAKVERLEREALARDADEARALVEDTQETSERLQDLLVPVGDPTAFLTMIEALAREQDVDMEVTVLTEHAGTNNPTRSGGAALQSTERVLRVEFMVSGVWSDVYALLALYELLPYATILQRVVLKESTEGPGIWVGQVHMLVQAK